MNHKFIYHALFSLLLCLPMLSVQAQVPTSFTTDNTWTAYSTAGRNLNPLTAAAILSGGTWGAAVTSTTLPDACLSTPLIYPGPPIFSPGNDVCYSGGDNNAILTSYFRRDFTLNAGSGPLCSGLLTVRADNNFRVYVDGTLIPGSTAAGCTGWTYTDLSGWNWNTIYTVNIMPFINLSLTAHTLLIEVGNCDYVNYLSAKIDILQELNCTPNAKINHSFFTIDSGCYLEISGLGSAGCYTEEDWTVYYKPSGGSTYSVLYSVSNSTRIGAARRIALPVGCYSYRIYHRVRYTRCNGTIVDEDELIGPFSRCCGSGGGGLAEEPGTTVDAVSGEVLTNLAADGRYGETPAATFGESMVSELQVYPNPVRSTLNVELPAGETADQIKLVDLQGRVVFEQPAPEQRLQIDCTDFPAGIYLLQVMYPQRGLSVQKIQINH